MPVSVEPAHFQNDVNPDHTADKIELVSAVTTLSRVEGKKMDSQCQWRATFICYPLRSEQIPDWERDLKIALRQQRKNKIAGRKRKKTDSAIIPLQHELKPSKSSACFFG